MRSVLLEELLGEGQFGNVFKGAYEYDVNFLFISILNFFLYRQINQHFQLLSKYARQKMNLVI